MRRLGVIMSPNDDPNEAEGVLNPASARGRDGQLYLFPRLVAKGNESRVGRARVRYDDQGDPCGVERLGVVLEPEESWESNARTGGVEDPRISHLPALDAWIMTYAAYGPLRSRPGLAISEDLEHWERLGPLSFAYDPALRTDLNLYPNKDVLIFGEPVPGPDGGLCYAALHRPTWDLSWVDPDEQLRVPAGISETRDAIWVSYAPASAVESDPSALCRLFGHRQVAVSEQPWEKVKIGGGTPPVRVGEGWLHVYHGVDGHLEPNTDHQPNVRYSAGIMVHDPDDVARLIYRSAEPVLQPELPEERQGIVPEVVFPTAIDLRSDGDADVFYGMADSRIGAARLHIGG